MHAAHLLHLPASPALCFSLEFSLIIDLLDLRSKALPRCHCEASDGLGTRHTMLLSTLE